MQFRKKPVVIEAFHLGIDPIPDWFMDKVSANECILHNEDGGWLGLTHAEIKTLEGVMTANKGDWIIKGVKDEVYPCKQDIFAATYERVTE